MNPLFPAFDQHFTTVRHAALALAQGFRARVAEMQGEPKRATRAQLKENPKGSDVRFKFFMPLHLTVTGGVRPLEIVWKIQGVHVGRSGSRSTHKNRITRNKGAYSAPKASLLSALKSLNPELIRETKSATKRKKRKTFAGLSSTEYQELEALVLETERQATLLRFVWGKSNELRQILRGNEEMYERAEEALALAPLVDLKSPIDDGAEPSPADLRDSEDVVI